MTPIDSDLSVGERKALDKFYTKPEAVNAFMAFINRHVDIHTHQTIVEPSAGDGAILAALPSRAVGVDLHPEHPSIQRHDFLTWEGYGATVTALTIGNPPFGKRSSLAIDFFNKAALHSACIAFIIPVTWEKFSIHRQLAPGWQLVASERLPEKSFELAGKPYAVRCCMQVWKKGPDVGLRHLSRPTGDNSFFDFVKKGQPFDFAIRQAYPKTVGPEDIDGQS
ncbi:MAG: hypothetical protein ACRCUF_00555, partial [Aeromonas sobria]